MLHHFKHELRHHAPMLFGWCVILGLHLFLSGSGFVERYAHRGANSPGLLVLLVAAVVLLPLFLVPFIVQGDAPLDEQAFWTTRPVRGKTLLGAKLLLVGLFFILLPLGIEMAIIGLRGGGSRMGLVVPEFLSIRGGLLCLAFAAGALGPRMLHSVYALVNMAFLAGVCVLMFVVLGGADLIRTPGYVKPSRVFLFGVVAIAGGLLSATVLYRTRKLKPGAMIAGGAVVLGAFAMVAWPWDLLGYGKDSERAAISVRMDPPRKVSLAVESRKGKELGSLIVPCATEGVTDGVVRPILFAKTRVATLTGKGKVLRARATDTLDPMDAESRDCIRGLFPGYAFGSGRTSSVPISSERVAFPRRFDGKALQSLLESKDCEVSLEGASGRFTFEIAGEIPLQEGAKWTDRGESFEISKVRSQGNGVELDFDSRELRQTFDRERCAVGKWNSLPWALVAVHPARKQAVWIQASNVRSRSVMAGFSPLSGGQASFNIYLRSEFDANPEAGDEQSWIDEGRLVIVRPVFHGVTAWDAGTATLPVVRN